MLHLVALASAPAGSIADAPWHVLAQLASGMRLPYLLVTGLGWQDFMYNAPVQVSAEGFPWQWGQGAGEREGACPISWPRGWDGKTCSKMHPCRCREPQLGCNARQIAAHV